MTLTLDEYKAEVARLKDLAREELADIGDREFILVISQWRDDEDILCQGTWHEVFADFNAMLKYIVETSESFSDEDDEEPIERRLYWGACKYKRFDGEIEKLLSCNIGTDGTILAVLPYPNYTLSYRTERHKQLYKGDYLLTSPHNIILPYKTGDVLLVDANPYAKPFFAVYGGELEKDEHLLSDHHYYHWCLYMSDDRKGLGISDISDSGFTDYVYFYNSPLTRISLADNCNEPLINKASMLLKENPALWFDWVEINNQHSNPDDGGLEQWIFED